MKDNDSDKPVHAARPVDTPNTAQPDSLGETECVPISIERDQETGIVIRWSDGAVTSWTATRLRGQCPCATCREKKRAESTKSDRSSGLPVLSAAEAQPVKIESMRPVGSYAYNIAFSDGHSSGIFPFKLLRTANDSGAG